MKIEALVQEARGGSDEAFTQLMLLHKDQMYRIAYAYLKNEHEALEAIQETTYRAWRTFGKLREARMFSTWLIRILLNCCNDEWKRKRRFRWIGASDRETGEPAVGVRSTEDDVLVRMQVLEAMDRLEPKYRQVLLLKYYEDMTLAEIAETLDRPLGTVKTWLHKALAKVKPFISEKGELWNDNEPHLESSR